MRRFAKFAKNSMKSLWFEPISTAKNEKIHGIHA